MRRRLSKNGRAKNNDDTSEMPIGLLESQMSANQEGFINQVPVGCPISSRFKYIRTRLVPTTSKFLVKKILCPKSCMSFSKFLINYS